ncbi:D-glycero-beta-D-manno-heptose-7-phosphate kinase [Magnetospira sp. QH-2]|uniref:D-glycero-beta-D-manno-heptose-7-phosphate kinase n=1 Tax=Magnetospira sp. (strain QH-2) TaxID=1288970 RepID=UPI0003E80DFA|nr:D-glycero-beta-D-manno-heptose-7-phosphate kinase [Magnetospira sp. QH-2]CCQ72027.1 Bifunctional protein heptose 7-phosphate kinase; heptose 1-phosphate adenyltransferase [Magnetospira sp. QH-2]
MNDPLHLTALVEALPGARVMVVGDVMLDRYIQGEVSRISPEAPIPVLRIEDENAMLGGAGNVVRNLVALGVPCRFLSALGEDPVAREIQDLLAGLPGVEATMIAAPGRISSVKTRFMGHGQQMLRADRETTEPLSATARAQLLAEVASGLTDCAALVLSDYGKGTLADGLAAEIIALANRAGKSILVDPKGLDYGLYRGAHWLTPNRKELAEASAMETGSDTAIVAAARHLTETCGLGGLLATRSQDGMSLIPASGEVIHLSAEAREVYDVSGAGDTVIATMAAGLAAGATPEQAAALANAAAGIVVGKVGTAVTYASELSAALHHQDLADAEARVLALNPALDRMERWRRNGLSVGFTNGCFDLLHPGHVSLLKQARATCDRLVVGLNSDDSVQRLKGPTRPVQSEMARATVLASLASVDMVVLFSEDTPEGLIEALRPDVLVKGADYTEDTVVGAPFVKSYGGRVVLAKLEDGHSTTGTISRING